MKKESLGYAGRIEFGRVGFKVNPDGSREIVRNNSAFPGGAPLCIVPVDLEDAAWLMRMLSLSPADFEAHKNEVEKER